MDSEANQTSNNDAAMIDAGFADTRLGGLEMEADEFDGKMIDDELNMSG